MRLTNHRDDTSLGAFQDEVETEAESVPAADLPVTERAGGRRWWHLGPYLDRVRGDSLFRNSLFIMANTAVTSAFGYVFWLVAAHLCSAPVVGLTAAIISAITIAVMISWVGVGGTLIQSLPGQSTETGWSRTFWAGMATVVFFAVVLCAIALVFLPLFTPKMSVLRGVNYAAGFAIATVALAVGVTFDWTYIAERRASNLLIRNSAAAAVKVIMVGFLGLAAGPAASSLLGAWATASVFGVGLGAALLVRHRPVARPPGLSVLIRTALAFRSRVAGNQVIGMAAGLLPYVLSLLMTARLSASDNAYFFTAWSLAGLVLVVSPAVSESLFAEGVHRPDELDAMARSAFKIIGAILLPGLVAVLVLGGILLSAFGPAYADHGLGMVRIIALATIPQALTSVYVGVLRALGRLTTVALLSLAISLGTLAISWLLLPVIGISVVGWAYLAMQLCGCVYIVLDRRKQTLPKRLQSRSLP